MTAETAARSSDIVGQSPVHISVTVAEDLAMDLLSGAEAIALHLGWRVRRVYHAADKGGLPIWKEPGVGLMSSRQLLREHFQRRAKESIARARRAG